MSLWVKLVSYQADMQSWILTDFPADNSSGCGSYFSFSGISITFHCFFQLPGQTSPGVSMRRWSIELPWKLVKTPRILLEYLIMNILVWEIAGVKVSESIGHSDDLCLYGLEGDVSVSIVSSNHDRLPVVEIHRRSGSTYPNFTPIHAFPEFPSKLFTVECSIWTGNQVKNINMCSRDRRLKMFPED